MTELQHLTGNVEGSVNHVNRLVACGTFVMLSKLWLSPIFPSRMADFGYDVAEYTAIAPLYRSVPGSTRVSYHLRRVGGGRPRKLGRAIGIDDYARRKGPRYNTLSVDLDKSRPIATFKGRRAEEVIAWFTSRSQAEHDQVEVVVMDMSKMYASIARRH